MSPQCHHSVPARTKTNVYFNDYGLIAVIVMNIDVIARKSIIKLIYWAMIPIFASIYEQQLQANSNHNHNCSFLIVDYSCLQ